MCRVITAIASTCGILVLIALIFFGIGAIGAVFRHIFHLKQACSADNDLLCVVLDGIFITVLVSGSLLISMTILFGLFYQCEPTTVDE
jgi:hypothetical protein